MKFYIGCLNTQPPPGITINCGPSPKPPDPVQPLDCNELQSCPTSATVSPPKDPRKLECWYEPYNCPLKTMCNGKRCEVVDCGMGTCPICPPGFRNLLIKAWCSYKCYPSGGQLFSYQQLEDYNPDEGDTIVGECESGGEISFACPELAIAGTYIDYNTCRHVTIDTWINWVRTPRGVDIPNGVVIDSRMIDSGTVIVDFQGNVPERTSSHIELKIDNGPYTPVTSPRNHHRESKSSYRNWK